MYQVECKVPSVDDYIRLRREAGVSPKTKEASELGLAGTVFGVVVTLEGEIIGMGRIIGDGGCFYQVVDIAVLPQHQRKGVGSKIMNALTSYLKNNAPKSAYVSLIADPGAPALYQKFGFSFCSPNGEGMFLRL